MDSIKLLTGYAEKLKQAQRELDKLSKKAQKLSQQQAEMDAQRTALVSRMEETQETITALETEDANIKPELLEAMMNDDTMQQRELKQRRKEIADAIRGRQAELEQLGTDLDGLGDLEHDSAQLAVELDMVAVPNWASFLDELRNSLRTSTAAMTSKQGEARRTLPRYSPQLYEELRLEQDEEYRQHKEFQESEGRRLQARLDRNRESLENAMKPHVGYSGYRDENGEPLPRGSVNPDGTVKPEYQNAAGTRRAFMGSRAVEIVR